MKDKIFQTTTDKGYVITEYDDGTWACSCSAWKFHKAPRVNCKHINEILVNGLSYDEKGEVNIDIRGLQKEKEVVIKNG